MKRIEQWLEKEAANKVYATTTISKYYNIGHLIIRYSDHIHYNHEADIQIISPTSSSCDYYTVIYNNSTKFMILNAKQIIEMIPILARIKELSIVTKPVKKILKQVVKEPIKSNLSNFSWKFPDSYCKITDFENNQYSEIVDKNMSTWNEKEVRRFQAVLNLRYTHIKGFNGEFMKFMYSTPCTFQEALTVFCNIVRQNNAVPTVSLCGSVLSWLRNNLTKEEVSNNGWIYPSIKFSLSIKDFKAIHKTCLISRGLIYWNDSELDILKKLIKYKLGDNRAFGENFINFLKNNPCLVSDAVTLYNNIVIVNKSELNSEKLKSLLAFIQCNL